MATSNNCVSTESVEILGNTFANSVESNTTIEIFEQLVQTAAEDGDIAFLSDGVSQETDETTPVTEEEINDVIDLNASNQNAVTDTIEGSTLIQSTAEIQGTQGPQGADGFTGPTGPAGSAGDPGPQGVQGAAGTGTSIYASVNNASLKLTSQLNFINTGSVKIAISNNSTGMTNVYFYSSGGGGGGGGSGLQGEVGAQGTQGSSNGPQGPQGPIGTGTQGTTGIQGDLGIQGTQGEIGAQGIQGIQGFMGAQGETGVQGTQGSFGIQGIQGVQGTQGTQGIFGVQGSEGDQGLQGSQGVQGRQGTTGTQGNTGIQGDLGTQGSQGAQGAQGTVGIQGNTGTQGNTGIQGNQGAQGTIGAQGVQGQTGTQGAQGVQGTLGNQGVQGTTGSQGTQGTQGTTGIQGTQGTQGAQGTQGTQGTQGSQGTTGSQGTQGIIGEQGEFGGASFDYVYITATANTDPGNGNIRFDNTDWSNITRLYISQLDSNGANVANYLNTVDDSTSTIKGTFKVANTANTLQFAFFNINGFHAYQSNYFSVPSAFLNGITSLANTTNVVITFVRTGDKGDTGNQGTTGAQGVQGTQGTQGVQGTQGQQGIDGTLGSQGPLGAQGTQGVQGQTGTQGVQGTTGAQGTVGLTGSQGTTGIQGLTGVQGIQGLQGTQGVTGSQGVQGADGVQGSAGIGFQGSVGAQGPQGPNGTQGATGAGTQGSTGAQGIQGTQGVQGAGGAQGVVGNQGTTGAQGVQGVGGAQGNTGTQGSQGFGNQGATGTQGAQGTQGSDGAQGTQGSQGVQGVQGAGISTSGTTDNVAKFATSTSIGNSIIVHKGSVVGIGTPNPNTRLHIFEDTIASTNVADMLKIETNRADFTGIGGSAIVFKNQDGNNLVNEARIKAVTENDGSLGVNNEATSSFILNLTENGVAGDKVIFRGDGNSGFGTMTPGTKIDAVGSIRASQQLISTVATGTAPLQVTSITLVNNLNADLLDGFNTSINDTADTVVVRNSAANIVANQFSGNSVSVTGTGNFGSTITGSRLISNVAVGTSPLIVISNTVVANLNAEFVGGNNITQLDARYVNVTGDTMTGTLNMHAGTTEGHITFGSDSATSSGIRKHDDGEQELYIYSKDALSQITIATGYDASVANPSKPTDGVTISLNRLGVGDFSNEEPAYKAHIKGDVYANGGHFRVSNNNGIIWETWGQRIMAADTQYLRIRANNGILFTDTAQAVKGYLYWDNSTSPETNFGLMNRSLGWVLRSNTTEAEIYGTFYFGSGYGNIVYDRNNTAYYIDPASTSNVNVLVANTFGIHNTTTSGGNGISLYNGAQSGGVPTYGMFFGGVATFGSHGGVTTDWATYFTMNNTAGRGWIFRDVSTPTSVASITNAGLATFNDSVRSPIFYDSNNTAYYTNPAGSSNISSLDFGGKRILTEIGNNTLHSMNPLWSFMKPVGEKLYADDQFEDGLNSISVYNNNGGSAVTHTRKNSSFIDGHTQVPNASGWAIEIMHAPGTSPGISPGYGGWYFATGTGIGRRYVCVFKMKVPAGRTVEFATNSMGTNANHGWLTNNAGTGLYEDYAYYVQSGTGSFSSTFFFYISGGSSTTFYTYLASATVYEVSDVSLERARTYIASSGMQAPIYYDSNDTNYYMDPNGTSRIRKTNLIASGSSWDDGLNLYSSDATNRWNLLTDEGASDMFRIAYNNAERFRIETGGDTYAFVNMRSPIFYDHNNTAFYGDFASRSILESLQLGSASSDTTNLKLDVQGNMAIRGTSGLYFGVTTNNFNSWTTRLYASGSTQYFNAQQFIFDNQGYGGTTFSVLNSDYFSHYSDVRTPIFYDSDNTGYYLDPNSTTALRTVGSWRADSAAWDGEFSGKMQYHANHWYIQFADLFILRNSGGTNVWYANQSGVMYAPFWYDTNDTNYYVDPNGTTRLSVLNVVNHGGNVLYDPGWGAYGFPGLNANSYTAPIMGFTYSNNAPYTGQLVSFGAGGYNLQLNATYGGGNGFAYRTRNGDNGTWNAWRYPALYDINVNGGGGLYATIYYDQNDTSYYCDPTATSQFSQLFVWGNRSVIRGSSPTLYFRDTDHNSAMIHVNSNIWYILRGGVDSESWSTVNGYWPLEVNLTNNNALFGNIVEAITDIRAPIFYDRNDTNGYIDPATPSNGFRFASAVGWWQLRGQTHWDSQPGIDLTGGTSEFRFSSTGGNVNVRTDGWIIAHDYLQSLGGVYGTIYYDQNDTGYYGDFNSLTNWQGLTTRAKAQIGLTGQSRSSTQYYNQRPNITGDSDYWTGSMGWGTVDMNTVGDWGSGFIDSWSNPGNQPAGTSHWVGVQSYHYTNGSSRYGWQMVGGPISGLWFRNTWASFSSWRKIAMYGLNEYSNDFWATIYYDANDSGRYADPNGTSQFNEMYASSYRGNANVGGTGNAIWCPNGIYSGSTEWLYGDMYRNGSATYGGGVAYYTILYDNNNSGYYCDPNSTSQLHYVLADNWFRPQGCTGVYWQSYGRGIWSPECEGNGYGNIATYGGGRNGWQGYGIGSRHVFMSTGGDNVGVHDNSRGWIWYWDGSYTRFDYGYTQFGGSARAPIFYDSNDTGYYLDPNDSGFNAGRMRGAITFGPNPSWGTYIRVGGNGDSGDWAQVMTTNGNLHLDPRRGGYATYLNWYAGGPVYVENQIQATIYYDRNDTFWQCDPGNLNRFVWIDTYGGTYNTFRTWTDLPGHHGFYSSVHNGAHFYPNNGTYGSWRIQGSRNGWGGVQFDGEITLMMSQTVHGFHSNYYGWRLYLDGWLYCPGNIVAYWSDGRLKENITELARGEGLDTIMKLKPSRFNWRKEAEEITSGAITAGFEEVSVIAQETQEVIPNAVVINKAGKKVNVNGEEVDNYLTVNYDKITPFLIQAIKDLKAEVDELREELRKERNKS